MAPCSGAIHAGGVTHRSEKQVSADDILLFLPPYGQLADLLPDSPSPAVCAVEAAHHEPCTHARLRQFILHEFDVRSYGLGNDDRIGLCFPTGPHAALAVAASLCSCVCVPINPAFTMPEIALEMESVGAKALMVLSTHPKVDELRTLAQGLGIRFMCATPHADAIAGLFCLPPWPLQSVVQHGPPPSLPPPAERCALVLHTSGSTGARKIVPHTLEAVVAGAVTIAAVYQLSERDTCLCAMPLFHVGGVLRNLVAPLLSGGSTIVCPLFEPALFWRVIEEQRPTWYYAGPTIHAVVLETFTRLPASTAAYPGGRPTPLRLIANAAGPLLHSSATRMQNVYGDGCSILPSYGMTECMPISSPPVDYRLECPGTSGWIAGPRVAIRDASGAELPVGNTGRITLSGCPLMRGYERSSGADAPPSSSVEGVGGWFDTGDLGRIDAEGWLYVTGRTKDVINRGGETIAPIAIEEALSTHPLVSGVLAFATPHELLQEAVGVCIVTKPHTPRPGLAALRDHCARSIHASKWPQLVCYLDALPASGTGKMVRSGVSQRLGLPPISESTPMLHCHYETSSLPPPGANPASATLVVVDLDLVRRALWYAVRGTPIREQSAEPSSQSLIACVRALSFQRCRSAGVCTIGCPRRVCVRGPSINLARHAARGTCSSTRLHAAIEAQPRRPLATGRGWASGCGAHHHAA